MAKQQISAEMLDTILTKVTDKFGEMLKTFISQLVDVMSVRVDRLEEKVAELGAKLSAVTSRLEEAEKRLPAGSPPTASTSTGMANSDPMLKAMIALELEKTERTKRARNVVITGLPTSNGVHDADVLADFCEQHLTAKPHPVRTSCRRVGKPSVNDISTKLRVTLDSEEAVDELISATAILRDSSDASARRVFFNRDLTQMEAQAAYEARLKRRSGTGHGSQPGAGQPSSGP
jgi:hypothetical protein